MLENLSSVLIQNFSEENAFMKDFFLSDRIALNMKGYSQISCKATEYVLTSPKFTLQCLKY